MTFSAKPIKPKLISVVALESAIISAGADIADGIVSDYNDAQTDFNSKSAPIRKHNGYKWRVEVEGKNFRYADHGTRPHKIKAKRAKYLKFRKNYKRKTKRGAIRSQPGGASGGVVFAKEVKHPGYRGSKITDSIWAKWFAGKRAVFIADREIRRVIG